MSEWTTNDDLNRDLMEGIMKNEKSDDEPVDGTGLTPKEALAMKVREKLIRAECDFIANMLAEKNRNYGDSALNPVRIMSQADPVEQIRVRIDDKLSRIKRGKSAGEDVVLDLIGYFILLRIAMRRQHVTGSVRRCSEHGGAGFAADCVDCAKPDSDEASALAMLRNLLARIHRDGGHHTEEVGLALSFKDADERVASLYSEHDDHLARVLSKQEPTDESWGLMVRHRLGKARGMLEAMLDEKEEGKTGEFTVDQIRAVLNQTADPDRRYDAVADALSWLWSAYPQSRGDVRKQMRRAMLALGRGPDADEPGREPIDRNAFTVLEPGTHSAQQEEIESLKQTLASARRVLTKEASKYQREADSWKEAAAQAQRNTDYYIGLIDQVAALLGPDVYVADDGSKQDAPVRAKVPSMVKEAFEELNAEAKRAWTHVEEIATALGCGTSKVQILMTLTKTMAKATRETEEARNGRDEAIRQRDALYIERDALAADNGAMLREIEALRTRVRTST